MSPVLQQKRQFLRLFSLNEWQQRDILLAGSESKWILFVTTGSFLGSRYQKQQFSKHARGSIQVIPVSESKSPFRELRIGAPPSRNWAKADFGKQQFFSYP